MDPFVPGWSFEGELPATNQKKPMGIDHEIVELLWQNGQVVLHSQTHRKPYNTQTEARQFQKNDQLLQVDGSYGDVSDIIQEAETVSWIEYPIDDSFDRDFCSNFFSELSPSDSIEAAKPIKHKGEEKAVQFIAAETAPITANSSQLSTRPSIAMNLPPIPMPPPKIRLPNSAHQSQNLGEIAKVVNFSTVSAPLHGEVRECSFMTVGSSHCGSNQVQNNPESSQLWSTGFGAAVLSAGPSENEAWKLVENSEREKTETQEQTVTSSSGGSGSSFGRACGQPRGVCGHKRKATEGEESECQSETAELDSAAGNKLAQRSGSSRRSRAAEVHNLSERRRRDRINEKMKTLKDLIPHCNKTDKASMLDEAIEYLKALQLQLQVMWMGGGLSPMMFPGGQHYMSRMGVAMGPPQLPPMPNAMQFPRVPLADHSISMAPTMNQNLMSQTPILNAVAYENQMQNTAFQEQYARYLAFHNLQTQPMNMFGPQTVHQTPTTGPSNGGSAAEDAVNGKRDANWPNRLMRRLEAYLSVAKWVHQVNGGKDQLPNQGSHDCFAALQNFC